jgi:hypothetical protein
MTGSGGYDGDGRIPPATMGSAYPSNKEVLDLLRSSGGNCRTTKRTYLLSWCKVRHYDTRGVSRARTPAGECIQ